LERPTGVAVFQWVGVVAPLSEQHDKLCRTVRAVNNRRLDSLDTFDKLVKVSMIGKGDGVIYAQPPATRRIDGSAGNANRDRPPQVG